MIFALLIGVKHGVGCLRRATEEFHSHHFAESAKMMGLRQERPGRQRSDLWPGIELRLQQWAGKTHQRTVRYFRSSRRGEGDPEAAPFGQPRRRTGRLIPSVARLRLGAHKEKDEPAGGSCSNDRHNTFSQSIRPPKPAAPRK